MATTIPNLPQPPVAPQFPLTIKVLVELEIKVQDQEQLDYYLDSATNTASANVLADVADQVVFSECGDVITINGHTQESLTAALQAQQKD